MRELELAAVSNKQVYAWFISCQYLAFQAFQELHSVGERVYNNISIVMTKKKKHSVFLIA